MEHILMQEMLTNSDFLDVILEHVHDGIYITDNEANTIYMNQRYEVISGLSGVDVLGKNMRELVAQGVISASGTLSVLETGRPISIEQSFRTGKRAQITSSPVYKDAKHRDQILMVMTVVREITEIHSVRKELYRSTERNRQLLDQVEQLQRKLNGEVEIIAQDAASVRTVRLAERIAILDHPILLSGEAGVGKAHMARYIHNHSRRKRFAFMRMEFAVVPKDRPMEYLFGYEDADNNEYHMGVFEGANGGTVYIDELTEVPDYMQGKLLSLMRTGSCVMGDGVMHRMHIRFITGSRYSYQELLNGHMVNPEILQCLSVMPLELFPLRERRDDIIPLLDHFLRIHNQISGEHKYFSKNCYRKLISYSWPENVREVEMLTQRAAILSQTDEIREEDLMPELMTGEFGETQMASIESVGNPENASDFPTFQLPDGYVDLRDEVAKLEVYYMKKAFEQSGNIRAAAEMLGMDSSTFVRKRQKYSKMGLM